MLPRVGIDCHSSSLVGNDQTTGKAGRPVTYASTLRMDSDSAIMASTEDYWHVWSRTS
jgi:hypothetical protein